MASASPREDAERARRMNVLNPLVPSACAPDELSRATVRSHEALTMPRRRTSVSTPSWTPGAGVDARAAELGQRAAMGDVSGTLSRANGTHVNGACGEDGRRPLHHAAAAGFVGCVEALLSRGAEPEARDRAGRTPLHEAARGGHAECARRIMDGYKEYGMYFGAVGHRFDVNARDASGATPLHEARERRMIEVLLREGADGSQRRGDGSNALHLACDRGDGWAVEALLGCGVDCDARDGVGRTALHRARDGRSALALCASGADVDVMSDDGLTPLHVASMDGRSEIVVCLINAGAHLRARSRTRGSLLPGATAADLAAKYGHDDVVRLLDGAKQVSRTAYLSTCAINHNEERFKKQMRRSSEKRVALVWGILAAACVVLVALLVGYFWYAGAQKELHEWRKIRESKEQVKLLKAKQKAAAEKAAQERKLKAEADLRAWQAEARQHVERVLKCGVYGTHKDGVKKGGAHRCVLFGADGDGLDKEASGNCGVCVGFLRNFPKSKSEAEVDSALTTACKKADGRTGKVCDSLLALRKDLTRQMSFGVDPAKICSRLGTKDPSLCAVRPAKEGDLSSDGKGDAAAREAFKRLSLFIHPDKHDNSEAATEAFKMLNTARAYMDSKARLKAKRAEGDSGS